MDRKSPFPHRRPILRWVDYARRSWQRLGHLRVLCALSHPANRTTLQGLANRFEGVTTRLHEIPVEIDTRVREHLRAHRRSDRRRRGPASSSRAELQDLYLSDPKLPSNSGAITGDAATAGYRHAVYVEIPAWGVRLRLLRRDNYTLTDRGKVLSALEPDLFNDLRIYNTASNPFLMDAGHQYFFLYCILDSDGDLIQKIFLEVLSRKCSFSRRDVGELAVKGLEMLSTDRLSRVTSGRERIIKGRIAETILSIRKQKGTGMGPCESVATPRTEPLVDCRIFERLDRSSYEYQLSAGGRQFAAAVVDATSIDDFLEIGLASYTIQSSNRSNLYTRDAEFVRRHLVRGYLELRSGLGYCSIRELAVLAATMAINEGRSFFEVIDAEQEIAAMAREFGKDVRLTKSRQGEIAQVRIAPRVVAEFKDA